MRALDANVLVRYLTEDDARQVALAEKVIEESRTKEEPLFLSTLAICEMVWVLSRGYRRTKAEILSTLDQILSMEQIQLEDESLIRKSLEAYRVGRANLADYVIGESGRRAGCRDTVTFDRALKGAPGFTFLS